MTRRDGDLSSKMPRMDKGEYSHQNSTGMLEKGQDLTDGDSKPKLTVASHSGKHSGDSSRHPSTGGNGHEGIDGSYFRDSPRSISLPGSRAGSRPGSRPGSRLHSRTNSQESIIDLFDCMTLAYGHNKSNDGQKGIQLVPGKGIQFVSPKPKQFRNQRWTWHDKVRINSAIWRAWHMQYIKGKKPVVCHFTAPILEKPRLNPDVIQAGRGYTGSIHWNQSQLDNIVSHYRKWRLKAINALQPQAQAGPGAGEEDEQDAEENAIDLDMPHPPHSPMFARKLANDDMPLKDFSDTLFISTGKKFNVPHPKKITQHVYNADIIQPGLMQLEPDFDDDFMDTLESLTDILMKTPTKSELQSFNVSADFPTCFLESDSLMETMDLNSQSTERVLQSNLNLQTTDIFPVSIQPSTPHYVRNLDFNTQTSSSQQQQQIQQQQQQQMQQQQLQQQLASGVYVTTNPQSSNFVVSGQPPMVIQSTATSQPLRTGFIPLTEVVNSAAPGTSNIAIGFQPNVTISQQQQQQQQSGPSLMQALTGNYNLTLPQLTAAGGFQNVGNIAAVNNITPIVSTATQPSHSVSSTLSKVAPLSPTPSHRPSCEVMGVINEAIDVLAYQLPMSPSRMIPPICTVEWSGSTSAQAPVTMQWTVAGNAPSSTSVVPAPPASMSLDTGSQGFVAGNQKLVYSGAEPVQRQFSRGKAGGEDMEFEAISPAPSTNSGSATPSGARTPSGATTPSGARTPSGAVTPSHKTNKRDRDGNFSRSDSTSPRTSFAQMYPESALHATLANKSDVKDLGMLSPSSTADREGAFVSSASYPSTAASSVASSPGTPHNETADVAQREFEFPTQKAKRQKTPDNLASERVDKETRRRIKHLKSEHKRRFNIQTGLDEMQALIPALDNTPEGTKLSTATLLVKAHEHITNLKEDLNGMRTAGEELKKEIEKLNDEIEKCQDELPDSGAPVNPRIDRQMQAMLDAYIKERSSANWKFWIFSLIVRPLFETYLNAVCDNPSTEFDTAVTEWIEEHCRLRVLRTVVLSALRQVSKRTSVLADPSKLPDQVNDIVTKECTMSSEKT